ncbi:hypothetical protein [Flagellimonas profundi]|uniref:Uncharacterized protein n=1 Tax=Flagellimonas profundi TaxID=2915620 RepID=A0ABS3FJU4_9FLAO|nr:hypothetical protein [Allomuricauda profundi]MBO0343470.1 hypothetical protein [Allomuricauda profundi]
MHKEEEINKIHEEFISKLERHYGKYDPSSNKFESTSNSKIARDLFYSDSQFSRLINNTASAGELTRALRNVQRLLDVNELRGKVNKLDDGSKHPSQGNKKYLFVIGALFLGLIVSTTYFLSKTEPLENNGNQTSEQTRYEMLRWGFENNYVKPYVRLRELPRDCYYPCYKYQGKWRLRNEYKIPFFRERNGFHYVAKEVVMYARCMDERDDQGESFEGYEYQKHEIWYDKREVPIDSFLTKDENPKLSVSYMNSNFENDPNYVKIAYVHTFFKTEFNIDGEQIQRSGKAIGRDIEFVPQEVLEKEALSTELLSELKSETNSIAKNLLEDFSKPITCNPTLAPNKDFNQIKEGDILSFNCQFSTGRFLVDYNKSYIFTDQYIRTFCR